MWQLKKIIKFFAGLFLIPFVVVYASSLLFQINFFEYGLLELLAFDYILVYILFPLLYQNKIKEYITNKYVFFVILFLFFYGIEVIYLIFYAIHKI
jgi:hypothetical protein